MASIQTSSAQLHRHSSSVSQLERRELFAALTRNSRWGLRISATNLDTNNGAYNRDFSQHSFYIDRKNNDGNGNGAISAIAIGARPTSDEEDIDPYRLEEQLKDLKALKEALCKAETLTQKVDILNNCHSVKAVFGLHRHHHIGKIGFFPNPVISLAYETLNEYEIYLLKCLVAGGQKHVLEAPLEWFDRIEGIILPSENGLSINGKAHDGRSEPKMQVSYEDGLSINGKGHSDESQPYLESINGGIKNFKELCCDGIAPHNLALKIMLEKLIKTLHEMETFYDSIGGIIGYQATALELIKQSKDEYAASHAHLRQKSTNGHIVASTKFFVPMGLDLSKDKDQAAQAAAWGIQALPKMGEIYPLGGAGDRLGLVDEVTGESLPVAMLPYCGRTLLEGLIRDLQAREFVHFKLYGNQEITPVAIMTSAAKNNNALVTSLCESNNWFGRGKSNFRLFQQPLIPAVAAEDGCWLISEPLAPILKPGGHGVIWKLAFDKGVFDWFYKKGCKSAIVRQISNPIAATDVTLLALAGVGCKYNKKFGFASCERKVGAAEGVNVLVEKNTKSGWEYSVTCIEYTEFSKLGIPDVPVSPGSMQAQYPANTNVLFVDLPSVEKIASAQNSNCLPGMILNLNKRVVYKDYLGVTHSTYAGRIECTMQNVADLLTNKFQSRLEPAAYHDCLDTFLIYNHRRKVTSSAKRQRKPTDFSLHQTPDGSFYDIIWNAHELLTSCEVDMPEMESKECYIESGPPFIALLHPAIGPLWSIIRQKIWRGSISRGSEVQLEVAEILWRNVKLEGSLLVLAENIVGSFKENSDAENILHYGDRCGRCSLQNMSIHNRGIDWSSEDNVYWKHKVHRLESVKIVLHGNSEFEAHDVTLEGSHTFEVPDGYRMSVTKGNDDKGISCVLHPLCKRTWHWQYTLREDGYIEVNMELEN